MKKILLALALSMVAPAFATPSVSTGTPGTISGDSWVRLDTKLYADTLAPRFCPTCVLEGKRSKVLLCNIFYYDENGEFHVYTGPNGDDMECICSRGHHFRLTANGVFYMESLKK